MIVKALIMVIAIMFMIIVFSFYLIYKTNKKLNMLKLKGNDLYHDIHSSRITLNLALQSLRDLEPKNRGNNDSSFIYTPDLSLLIEIIEEVERDIHESIDHWNIKT